MTYQLHHGNCLDILPMMERESVDAIVTDPPYGLGFMGKDWDHGVPGEHFWREAYRVAKPGAFLLCFGGDRTHHRLMVAIEDAGWEIRTCIYWIFGSGFPKSHNVSSDLRAMPACSCGIAKIPRHVGRVDSALPSKFIGARVGTESASVFLAGLPADKTSGLISKSSGGTLRGSGEMQGGVEQSNGQLDPVMFGPLDMAGVTKGDQVGDHIGVIESNPESLRDQMVGDEFVGTSTVNASAISADNLFGDGRPLAPFVPPSAISPSGISAALESDSVIDGHAISGTVDRLRKFPSNGLSAGLTDESIHESDYTTERQALQVCDRCGKIIADSIPDGLGTALKPAAEIIVVARRPLQGTVAENVQRYGTGAMNIDGCRIESNGEKLSGGGNSDDYEGWGKSLCGKTDSARSESLGRWPANLIHDGSAEVLAGFPVSTSTGGRINPVPNTFKRGYQSQQGYRPDGLQYKGEKNNPSFSGNPGFGDTGSAARFFYTAKSSKSDRNEGLEIDLQWLDSIELIGYNDSTYTLSEVLLWEKQGRSQSTDSNGEAQQAKDIFEDMTRQQVDSDSPISSNGNDTTGLSLKAIRYTTSTGTRATIELRTLNSLMRSNTSGSTEDAIRRLMELGLSLVEGVVLQNLSKLITTSEKMVLARGVNSALLKMQRLISVKDALQERHAPNIHSTVKPTALMRYLCRLVTPPQGVILDPFMGSGSTGKAAILEGFNFVGIDTEIEYVEIAARRIEHACSKVGIVVEQPMTFETQREKIDTTRQMILL